MSEPITLNCCLCGKSIPIEASKTNGHGEAVHENCVATLYARLSIETNGFTNSQTRPKDAESPPPGARVSQIG
jgi:hypothetical protein